MSYDNLHEYLDAHLGENPSAEDIKYCKNEYWKWYRSKHRKRRVTEAKALNLTINSKLWEKLKVRSHNASMNIYDFIKQHLESGFEPNVEMNVQFTLEIMIIFELLKDYTHGDVTIETVLNKFEHLILKL